MLRKVIAVVFFLSCVAALRAQDPSWQVLDLRLAPGVAVQRDAER